MQRYSDKTNQDGLRVLFVTLQMFMLLVVFTIIYTSFVAVQYAVQEQGISTLSYIPILFSLVLFPVLLYKYREMFTHGKMLGAAIWTISSASVMIVLLYLYIDRLVA